MDSAAAEKPTPQATASSTRQAAMTEYLRAAEIARLTGMTLRTVRRWIAGRILPSTKVGGARLVARADLDRLLSPSRT